jgi:hypothetical protein
MLAVGSIMAVAEYSIGSSTAVVATSAHWVSTSEAATIASGIEGTAFALPLLAGSSVVV